MSNQENNKDKNEFTKGIVVVAILAIGLAAVLFPIFSNNSTKESENVVGYVEGADYSDSNITTYKYKSDVLHGEELDVAIDRLNGSLDSLRSTNAYFQVQVGEEDFDYYIYNKQGEGIAQTYDGSATVIYRKDGEQSISYGNDTGTLMIGNDIDIISLMQGVINLAATDMDGVTFFDMQFSEDELTELEETNFKEYRIDIVGEEAFLAVYKDINLELGQSILDSIKTQVSEQFESEFIPHAIYTFFVSNENGFETLTTACHLVIEDNEILNWVQDGYLELGDWSLDESWYTTDFENITEEESLAMVEGLIEQIEKVLEDFAIENNIPMDSELEEESTSESALDEEVIENSEEDLTENEEDSVESEEDSVENEEESADSESAVEEEE